VIWLLVAHLVIGTLAFGFFALVLREAWAGWTWYLFALLASSGRS
jgi:hypothetical protein